MDDLDTVRARLADSNESVPFGAIVRAIRMLNAKGELVLIAQQKSLFPGELRFGRDDYLIFPFMSLAGEDDRLPPTLEPSRHSRPARHHRR